jgi:D-arabinose 1-dehydrogenase-like Zn-dependent alcohol dehydrogenase
MMLSYRLEKFALPFAAVECTTPTPTGRQVVVDVKACGLCHSDIHLHDGYFDLGDGAKIDATRIVNPPRTLGHEIVGTVSAIGPDVTDVKFGEKRVVFPWIGCGKCSVCQAGNEHLCNAPAALGVHCDGGFANKVLVPDAKYLIDYGALPDAQACTYACSGLTAYSALKKVVPFPAGGRLLIIGAGGVGLSGVRLAKAMGLPAPIVAEVDKSKWDLAKAAGASECIDPTEATAVRTLMKATAGGVQAAIDFVGAGSSFAFAFSTLGKAGTLVSVGLFGGATPIAPAMISMKAVTIKGSYVGSLQDMRELMDIARSGTLAELPVATRPLSQINDALADLKQGRVRGRVVMLP